LAVVGAAHFLLSRQTFSAQLKIEKFKAAIFACDLVRSAQQKSRLRGGFFARAKASHLIFVSLNSTCLRAIGSYFFIDSFSVLVRAFFEVT
jgi:hypothetical protein